MLLVLGLKFLFIPVTSTRRTLEGESLPCALSRAWRAAP